MLRHRVFLPGWRKFGAFLGILAILVQVLLLTLYGALAQPTTLGSNDPPLCTHDVSPGGTAPDDPSGASPEGPTGPAGHFCPACTVLHFGGILNPPSPVGLGVPAGRSEISQLKPQLIRASRGRTTPYGSRAPPRLT